MQTAERIERRHSPSATTVLPETLATLLSTDAAPHEGAPHLAHHFDSHGQQFEAAKLGMWLFLATEVLLFGGLFCLYAVYRGNHPEIFEYGSQFLDTNWGAINTVVLILSSLTMALAVWCAQCNHQKYLTFFLLLTLLFAGDFLLIKYLEYSHKIHDNLVWGIKFYEAPPGYVPPAPEEEAAEETPEFIAAATTEAPDIRRQLWNATCRACHGVRGEGITGQGKDMRGSEFILARSDQELIEFIKKGRMPFDPENTTGIQMPPRGGNPMLKDDDLLRIVGYLRTFEGLGGERSSGGASDEEEEFWIPRSVIPPAAAGPPGLNLAVLNGKSPVEQEKPRVHHAFDPDRPANAQLFFGIYFLMTGLHGIHVFAGMLLIAYLLIRSMRGHFGSRYFTPVDLGGLYWHVVDVIWIFLFPLLYLIR